MKLRHDMRLTSQEIAAIVEVFRENFLVSDHIWLFGSRIDDLKRGGDIDLYVEAFDSDIDTLFQSKLRFLRDLQRRIGEQKIDVVICHDKNSTRLIDTHARETGILLT